MASSLKAHEDAEPSKRATITSAAGPTSASDIWSVPLDGVPMLKRLDAGERFRSIVRSLALTALLRVGGGVYPHLDRHAADRGRAPLECAEDQPRP
jgi:hypothetical protein